MLLLLLLPLMLLLLLMLTMLLVLQARVTTAKTGGGVTPGLAPSCHGNGLLSLPHPPLPLLLFPLLLQLRVLRVRVWDCLSGWASRMAPTGAQGLSTLSLSL